MQDVAGGEPILGQPGMEEPHVMPTRSCPARDRDRSDPVVVGAFCEVVLRRDRRGIAWAHPGREGAGDRCHRPRADVGGLRDLGNLARVLCGAQKPGTLRKIHEAGAGQERGQPVADMGGETVTR